MRPLMYPYGLNTTSTRPFAIASMRLIGISEWRAIKIIFVLYSSPMSFKLRIKMPRFIFMWFLSVIAYSCSSTNSAEAITNEYLAILEKATHSPKEAKKELWNLINVGDRNYLQEVSEVYASKNDSIWMKYLKSSMHKEIESQWFNASLEKGIRDTSEFLDYVLIDLMSFDRGLFNNSSPKKVGIRAWCI